MRCSDRHLAVALSCVVLTAGCGWSDVGMEVAVEPPHLDALSPASGVAGERVAVVISGRGLHPRLVQDVGHVSGVRVDAGFSAWLGEVPLEQVTWVDATRLEAVIPPGLAAGRHDLHVRTPNGLVGSLASAYRAVDPNPPLEVVVLPQPEVTSVGGLIGVRVRVTNRGSADLEGVEARGLTAVPEGLVALTSSGASDPVALAPGASVELPFTFVATAPGELTFVAGASGVDMFGNVMVTPALASSAPVTVQRAAGLSLSLEAEPGTVIVGSTTTVTLTVENQSETGAAAVTPTLLLDDTLLAWLEGPTPSAADVPPGADARFTFLVRALARGNGLLTGAAAGADVLSWADVVAPRSTILVVAVDPPTLSARWTVPSRVSLVQRFVATLEVSNTGGSDVVALAPTLVAASTSGVHCEEPAPSAVASLLVGERATFVFSCQAAEVVGALTLSASVSGLRAVDGAPVAAGPWTSGPVVLERPPELKLTFSEPAGAAEGRRYGAAVTIRNVGEATALHAGVASFTVDGDTGTLCGAEPANHVDLAAGDEVTYRFDCAAGGHAGRARLWALVSGTDENSGLLVEASGRSAGVDVVPSASLPLVISEVVTDPRHDWSDDSGGNGVPFDHVPGHGVVNEHDEWLELYNAGPDALDLRGLVLTFADATPSSLVLGAGEGPHLRFSDGGTLEQLAPGEYLVIGAPAGAGGVDDDAWIYLDTPDGLRVDEVALGSGLGGPENLPYNAPSGSSADERGSTARVPTGADSGRDATDFARAPFTIGRDNDCASRSPVTFVSASSASANGPPLSFAHAASDDDGALVVGVVARGSVSDVRYGGVALTRLGGVTSDGATLWALAAPPAGDALVVVHASSGKIAAGAVSLAGAHQAEPVGVVVFEQGNGRTPTFTVDVPSSGATVVDLFGVKQFAVATPGAEQAFAWQRVGGVGGDVGGGASTLGPVATPGPVPLAWSIEIEGPDGWTWVAAALEGQCQ